MAKKTTTAAKPATTKAASKAQDNTAHVELDWNAECATIQQAAKEKEGSRGNLLGKLAVTLASGSPTAQVLRAAASLPAPAINGAQAFIQQPRNVLDKLTKIARALADGTPYCAHDALDVSRAGDASVPVALVALGAGDARQKQIVAAVSHRYKGGGNAQMPAALEGLRFFGIVNKLETGSVRNSQYEIADSVRAESLIPKAPNIG